MVKMSSEFSSKLVGFTSYALIGMILVNSIGMVNSIIVARLFNDPALLGKLFIIQNIQAVVAGLVLLSIPIALITFIAKNKINNKHKLEKILSNGLTLLIVLSAIGALLYYISSSIIATKLYNDASLGLLMKINSLNIVFLTFSTFCGGLLQGFKKIKELALYNIINSLISIPLLYIFISKMSLLGSIIAFTISSFVSLIIVTIMVFKILKTEEIQIGIYFGMQETYDTLLFSLPIFISSFIYTPTKWFIATLLSNATGLSQVGYFKIGTNLQALFLNIPSAIGVPLLPMISEIYVTNPNKIPIIISRLLRLNILITLPFILTSGITIKYLILFFYGARYEEAWMFSYIVLISLLFISMSPITMNIFLGIGKTWIILYLDILSTFIYIIFSYYLINIYGIVGIGFADIISNIILSVVKLIYLKFKLGVEIAQLRNPFLLSFISIILSYYLIQTMHGFSLIITGFILIVSVVITEYYILTIQEKEIIYSIWKNIKSKV